MMFRALLFIFTIFSSPASANDLPADFKYFIVKNKPYINAILDKAIHINDSSIIRCDAPESRQRLIPDIVSSVTFGEVTGETKEQDEEEDSTNKERSPYPEFGQWIEHVRQNGCQTLRQINILAVALPGRLPQLFPMKPGTTISDPYLQTVAEERVTEAALTTSEDCNAKSEINVVDTVLEGYFNADQTALGTEDENYGWQERWVTATCGVRLDIKTLFLPDLVTGGHNVIAGPYGQALGKDGKPVRQRYSTFE